ncbi:MAG: DUF4450 domain-containing protein [Ferruginibacter sp.]
MKQFKIQNIKFKIISSLILFVCPYISQCQELSNKYWHDIERTIRYHPEGTDFLITNGNRRFTRALYGTNTAFRLETGDLPEFAMYMPGMGGNFKFGLINADSSKWLINADSITARYRPGSMLYEIKDAMLGKGKMHIAILALADAEGMIIKVNFENVLSTVKLFWSFGGASGKKFSRDGDMGPDPESSFYLKPEYCLDNNYSIEKNTFTLKYGTGLMSEPDPYVNRNPGDSIVVKKIGKEQILTGIVPVSSDLHIGDASKQNSPDELYHSQKLKAPAVTGAINIISGNDLYFFIQKPGDNNEIDYSKLPQIFNAAEVAREKIAGRIKVVTPDPYINTIGAALGIAADAIWESPSYMHGSVGWRMRLNGWRGPYVADVLGWHDRARSHFRSYALSQVIEPASGPVVADTALHLARSLEKMGTSVFSSGYISRNPGGDLRPHHYDMNLVYIDELLWHFKWTGDLSFVKEMWPVLKRHLAWEKRNFDADNDGLYDAYAAIWASDALTYSGGSVTHSSAYNYRANKIAAELAVLIGEDPQPYRSEAKKIFAALNKNLWMPDKGWFAEYKDAMGLQLLHPDAALWTIYHSIDSDVPDAFQAYQSLKYIDEHIPHIPVKAKGLENGYYTLSTSNWMPYDWSLNNVATAEVMHTALAYWEGGQNETAFNLWKSELLSTMYLGGSPGNIGQISFYDAQRGEAYRDFADPVGMTARSLIQGLFGIIPDALHNEITIRPGFPAAWKNASLQTPDIKFDFKREDNTDFYHIVPSFNKEMKLQLLINAKNTGILKLTVNGKAVNWKNVDSAVDKPMISLNCGTAKEYIINIIWNEKTAERLHPQSFYLKGAAIKIKPEQAVIKALYDPQHCLQQYKIINGQLTANATTDTGNENIFLKLSQGIITWWQPVEINIRDSVEIGTADFLQSKNNLKFHIRNNNSNIIDGSMQVNASKNAVITAVHVDANNIAYITGVPPADMLPGTNDIRFSWTGVNEKKETIHQRITNWNIDPVKASYEKIDLNQYFNDKVTNIFKNQYLSPRPATATLQLPTQGIGDWTHPLKTAEINDVGLRKAAGEKNEIMLPQGIPFATASDSNKENILFTSQWDNYPKEKSIALKGNASHAYFLMSGSTNPMQTAMTNGIVVVNYADGSSDSLVLKNPENWWPIEQDYYDDGYAFRINAARPVRIHLKTGKIVSDYDGSIQSYNGKMIDGGAATVLDLPLDINKALRSLTLKTVCNDVVIGLMAVTLVRSYK